MFPHLIDSFRTSYSFKMIKKLLFISLAIGLLSCESQERADTIVYNAKIYTVDSLFTVVEAMALKDGEILETGTTEYIKGNYQAIEEVDAQKNFVYPGFIDAHCHFIGYAKSLRAVNLVGTKSFYEVIGRIVDFQNENNLAFISGRGWDQNDWEDKRFPNKLELDQLFPATPVLISRIDGHAVLANQAALDYANVPLDTLIVGGIIEKDKEGNATGILIDNAVDLIKEPDLAETVFLEAIKEAQENCFSYGLTTLDDAGLDKLSIELIDSLQKAEFLKMRIYAMVSDKPDLVDYYLKSGKIKTDHLNVRSFKYYADGALGSRGACLNAPYSDHKNHVGFLLSSEKHFRERAATMAEEGWQMNTHAIGDSANRVILDVYGESGKGKRWRIEHAQIVDKEDFQFFKKYEIIPSVQPTHATSDMYWAEDRLGKERISYAYAYKQLLSEYGKLALGTDFPVEDISTIKTFYAATVRKDLEGYPKGGFQMENAISREEALKGMTIWAAYSNFEEKEKGSLEAGKFADFVILDKDWMNCLPEEIPNTIILSTYLAGKEVFNGWKN